MIKKLMLLALPPAAVYSVFVFISLEPSVLAWSAEGRYWLVAATCITWGLSYLSLNNTRG